MTTKCAWCLKTIKQGKEGEPVSHGICTECAKLLAKGDTPKPAEGGDPIPLKG